LQQTLDHSEARRVSKGVKPSMQMLIHLDKLSGRVGPRNNNYPIELALGSRVNASHAL
jgi:hypothetical protein